jgi:hypothetical protein
MQSIDVPRGIEASEHPPNALSRWTEHANRKWLVEVSRYSNTAGVEFSLGPYVLQKI